MEGIQQPTCDVSSPKGNNSFEDDDNIISTEDCEEIIQFESISGKTYSILKTMNEERLLLDQSKCIPLPYNLSILSRETLAMDPIDIELMLFINKHFLPPSYFDHINIFWAFKARDDGYFQTKQRAPTHQKFK